MDKTIIRTSIPLSPSLINQYCQATCRGDNNILFEFDISSSPMEPNHILGYLANLKIDFIITGHDEHFMEEYMKSMFFVGHSNLIEEHKMILLGDDPIGDEHKQLIRSLPLFLLESSSVEPETKNRLIGCDVNTIDDTLPTVGVNFAHFVNDPTFFLLLIGDKIYDFVDQNHYTHYFDKYIYDGDNLIKLFIDNPDNLLNLTITSLLRR